MEWSEIKDELSDHYMRLLDGKKVPFEIAALYYKENDGFMQRTPSKAVAFKENKGGLEITMYEVIEEEDGSEYVREIEYIVTNVQGRFDDEIEKISNQAKRNIAAMKANQQQDDPDEDLDMYG